MTDHVHGEAFMLMTYASRDGAVIEKIWNSRDGVTPFVVSSRDGQTELHHVNWQSDEYRPDYQPEQGSRIFVDLTPERSRQLARSNAERFWDHPGYPASKDGRWASIDELAAELAREYLTPGAPDLVVVAG